MSMHTFDIELIGVDEVTLRLEDALFEGHCDDALLCSEGFRVSLLFDREAPSLQEAIRSAISDIYNSQCDAVAGDITITPDSIIAYYAEQNKGLQ